MYTFGKRIIRSCVRETLKTGKDNNKRHRYIFPSKGAMRSFYEGPSDGTEIYIFPSWRCHNLVKPSKTFKNRFNTFPGVEYT